MEAAVSYWLNLYEHITQQTGRGINRTEEEQKKHPNTRQQGGPEHAAHMRRV